MVKAFNYAFAPRMADPAVDGIRLDGFVAGDDQAAQWSWPECSSPWPF